MHHQPVSNLKEMLSTLEPVLHEGVYVFASAPSHFNLQSPELVGLFREEEGATVIVSERAAIQLGLSPVFRAAWITLRVHSDLQAVGLTAAFSRALADEGISCNVVAGVFHDHLFVPVERAELAFDVLKKLQHTHA